MVRGKHHTMAQGQAWSIDLVIGVLIFLLAIGTIYSLLNNEQETDPAPLRIESEVIATILTSDASNQMLQVANGNQLSMRQLGALANRSVDDYQGLKRDLGVEHEFCIYLQDENGNLVYITDADNNKYTGVGAGDTDLNLTQSNVPCGQPCTINPITRLCE